MNKKSMSYLPFLLTVLIISPILCMFVNSWLLIWMMLEMNTLSFCSMMKSFKTDKKNITEMSMKYFIIQSISSALLVFSSISMKLNSKFFVMLVIFSLTSLMIKMAASPFHFWFISIVKKTDWKNSTILMTWQKFAPVYLLTFQLKYFIYPFMLLSSLMGSIPQINKKDLMEIMALSSIFNISWMMMSILMSMKNFLIFSLIYWISVIMMMILIITSKIKVISSESVDSAKKWICFMVMLNLAGIPPMAGFLAKWLIFKEGLSNSMMLLVTLLLSTSSINLYIYMRIVNFYLMKNSPVKQKNNTQMKKIFMNMTLTLNILPMTMIVM